ncbi:MAG: riboflavin synthase [Minisyncoccia bacterium]
MFTGIIQAKTPVLLVTSESKNRVVRVEKPKGWKLALGQSVSIDGICSTVVKDAKGFFEVVYMPETLGKTTAFSFIKGKPLNLERSLTLASVVDGHLLLGHVDSTAKVISVEKIGTSRLITIEIPKEFRRYVALHGSISVNGVSLTVARRDTATFSVALIPHTLKETNLGDLVSRDTVNIEIDLIARYLLNPFAKKPQLLYGKKKVVR